ncbi:MAG TPA: M48 family metalloprotease, partial [Armatimonadota bacterium]|nr:M48 family metalloprotease [Armatimonadota bacterium]
MFRLRLLVAVIVLLTAAVLPALSKDSDEVELGRKLAERFEEKAKLITDEALLEQVNDIGQRLAEVARTLEVPAGYGSSDLAGFDYQFKVVDNEDINAFSLPGGIIYIYSGLIDFVETDDELAGVLAHEIAHASHHHVMALSKKQSKMDAVIALVALAGGLGKMDGRD